MCDSRAASSRDQLERSKVGGLVAGEDGRAVIPLVVRGDVTGSVEVLVELLRSRQPEELELNVVATGVGGVSEGDVEMAASTGGEGHCTTIHVYLKLITKIICNVSIANVCASLVANPCL